MAEYYTLQVAGLTRKLKRCRISDKLEIAAFILFLLVEIIPPRRGAAVLMQ